MSTQVRALLWIVFALTSCRWGPSLELACEDYARATCSRRNECAGGRLYPRAWADEATCISRSKLACENAYGAPDTHITPRAIETCAEKYSAVTCLELETNDPGGSCAFTSGTRANGAGCSASVQCASGYCGRIRDALCGTCSAQPPTGADCATSSCGRGLVCSGTTKTCVVPVALGAACAGGALCEPGSTCVAASGQSGSCVASIDTVGASCADADARCDGSQFLACQGALGPRTCEPEVIARTGEPCGGLPDGTTASCEAGSCTTTTNSDGTVASTCMGTVTEGATCDSALGPSCLAPARCITGGTGTAGTCALPDPSSCK